MTTTPATTDADDRRDVRGVKIAFWVGVVAGLGHGIPKYGLFSMFTVALVGLMIIAVVGLYAALIALLPARPLK